jgi:hypothetical protein
MNRKLLYGRRRAAHSSACSLGLFSIGLGFAELLAARTLARFLGMQGRENVLRAYGVREIATGIGILSSRNPSAWVWARVAGDGLDLATLARGRNKGAVAVAASAVAGVAFADFATARILGEIDAKRKTAYRDYSDRSGIRRKGAASGAAAGMPSALRA